MLPLHLFVRCRDNGLGIGKLVAMKGKKATVEYFDSPAQTERYREVVDVESLGGVVLDEQTRVHFLDPETHVWQPGRALVPIGDRYLVAFPSNRKEEIPCEDLFVRWDRPIEDPTAHLASRLNETPFFHEARAGFVRALVEQRASAPAWPDYFHRPSTWRTIRLKSSAVSYRIPFSVTCWRMKWAWAKPSRRVC